ncbi:hypothetical protein RO3G_08617 [Lichtheimia corymbifera JMRC:FSU:9682]|uniref:Tyr recombinase domain-containing protein n=1 Tax=Lichtheimia corymbifera JMRC:FSU:9682 TaxID=1263082 RepID=A0A068SHS2_9FUNG|nr:hypothetical protein RO3G_08617 [Lichtheimia corymbifera JMRC:FSU:9682]
MKDCQHYHIPEDGIHPGGRLTRFATAWHKHTWHKWAQTVVQEGYRLQFHKQPIPWKARQIQLSPEDQTHVDQAVATFLNSKVIEISPTQDDRFLSNFFTIKEPNKIRPILDCKRINQFTTLFRSPMPSFQNGRRTSVAGFNREGRLACEIGSERCVRGGAYSRGIETLSFIPTSRYNLPIPISPIWLECGTKGLLQIDALCRGRITPTRYSDGLLFGRHLHTHQVKSRDAPDHGHGDSSFVGARLYYQLEEKLLDTITHPRLFGVHLQHFHLDNQCAQGQDDKADDQDQASYEDITHMQVDSGDAGQDYFNDSSNRRCIASCPLSSTGSIESSQFDQSGLGSLLSSFLTSKTRADVVAANGRVQKWLTNASQGSGDTYSDYLYGCIRHWLGHSQQQGGILRLLEPTREDVVDQCTRVEDHPFCITRASSQESECHFPFIHGQCYRPEIQQQGWRYSITNPTRSGFGYIRDLPQVQYPNQVPTHRWCGEQGSRQVEPYQETSVRVHSPSSFFQPRDQDMGEDEDRRICLIRECTPTEVLELATRQECSSNRCVQASLAEEGSLSSSTMAIDSISDPVFTAAEGETSSVGDSELANTVLVADGDGIDNNESIGVSSQEKPFSRRMEIINNKRKADGLTEEAAIYLDKAKRRRTHRRYDSHWDRWEKWCKDQQPQVDSMEYDAKQLVNFLMAHRDLKPNTLNGIRSGIASVFKETHPSLPSIGEHRLVSDFLKAHKAEHLDLKNGDKPVWNVDLVLNVIRNWGPADLLSLQKLQVRTVILLCVATMWRPRSDIGAIQKKDVEFVLNNDGSYNGATLLVRYPKEGRPKTSKLARMVTSDLCPVFSLWLWIQKTKEKRTHLPEDHKLFLTNVESSRPKSVREATIASWVKAVMEEADIDTSTHTPHSIRSASSTKAVTEGSAIQAVKEHANWSLTSTTFEDYYYRPVDQHGRSRPILATVFDQAENRTTSIGDLESPRIVVGTTDNALSDDREP